MKIPIVNEQDEIIGYKERSDRNKEDIIRVRAVWVTDENGNILLQQRKLTKKENPGKWGQAVGGTVEEGETYESNAYKEMEEEIGVANVPLTLYKKIYRESNLGKRFLQLYTAQIPRSTKLIPQEDEVEALRWVTKKELQKSFAENPEMYLGLIGQVKGLLF